MNFHHTVADWQQFRQHWGGLHNFLLGGDITADFDYPLPPLERIVDEVRCAPESIVRSGIKGDAFDLTDMKEQFVRLPLTEALRSRFVLAHFGLHPYLSGPGQVFQGIDDRWVDPWRQKLRANGFTFKSVFAILFASGPNSASNYHLDITHQLAWQRYGTKHFVGLKTPDNWTTLEQRGRCQLKGSVKPAGITAQDVYAVEQPPGSFLWNAHTTPHWVETFDECAVTLTLVHEELRLDGQLCPHAAECARWRKENA
ncbi:MAG: hypothetical protein IT440_11275 [Phycisphaeraceae bacterium]|nr:hypothetical protein [Phycisphaeraceae bacterium]